MWFANPVVYQFNTPFEKNAETIQSALEEARLKPCPPHARQTQGWVNPLDDVDAGVYSLSGCHLLAAAKEVRLLPASVIKTILEEKRASFELTKNRPMRRNEILQMKEDLEFDLLPKAFTVQKKDWLYIDTGRQWLVINSANPGRATEVLASLGKTLGTLSASLLTVDADLNALFADWLLTPSLLPEGLTLGKSCVLVHDGDTKSQYNCRDIEQNQEELATLLAQDYRVSSIELIWEERIQFTLTNDFLLKRLKCIDYLEDAFQEHKQLDSRQAQLDADFSLMTGELGNLLIFLMKACTKKKETVAVDNAQPSPVDAMV